MSRLISQFFCNLNSSNNFTCLSGKLITEFTSPIAKSTSLRLSDTTLHADIIRICKYYGYSIENLDLRFQSLILSVFTDAIEVWGCALYSKYLSRIDKLFARCYKSGYCFRQNIPPNRGMKLWQRFSSVNTALSDLLPPQRTRRIFYLMSGQVVLNPFLLIHVS